MSNSQSEDAAAAAAAELIADDEAQETESGSEETEQEEEVEFPDFDIALPADLAAELEEDEVDMDVQDEDDELEAMVEQHGEDQRELARQLLAEKRRSAHYEGLRAKEARKNWAEEAKQFFPLSEPFLDEINATSRRGYLRTAKLLHGKMRPIVDEKVLKPAREAMEKEKTKTVQETRQEAKAAWGQPTNTEENKPPEEAQASANVEHARRRRGELSDIIRGMIFTKE